MASSAGIGGPVSNQVTNYSRTPTREVEARPSVREERSAPREYEARDTSRAAPPPPPETESRSRGSRVNILV
jgi:hypothetical protein